MNYARRRIVEKPNKKRGRPKKSQDYEATLGDSKETDLMRERDAYKKQLDEMRSRLDRLEGAPTKEEEFTPLNMKKIETSSILSASHRNQLVHEIKQYERMLKEKETLINASRAASGGETSCFIRNDRTDRRIIYGKLIKAKRAIDYGTHGKLSEPDRKKLITEKKRLENILGGTFPSHNECNDPKKADRLAGYLYKHNKTFGKEIKKLQNINKILDPDNPSAGDLKYLYKK